MVIAQRDSCHIRSDVITPGRAKDCRLRSSNSQLAVTVTAPAPSLRDGVRSPCIYTSRDRVHHGMFQCDRIRENNTKRRMVAHRLVISDDTREASGRGRHSKVPAGDTHPRSCRDILCDINTPTACDTTARNQFDPLESTELYVTVGLQAELAVVIRTPAGDAL